MKRPVKIAFAVIGALLALLLIGILVLYMSFGSIVKTGVETLGPQMTQSDITVDSVDFSVFSGMAEIQGIVVGNPAGYKTDAAFRLGQTRIVVAPASVLSDRIVIREVLIDGPEITYEAGLGNSNIGTIKKNIEAFAARMGAGPQAETPPAAEKPAEPSPGKKVQIDDFRITNAKVRLSAKLLGGQALTLTLPEIHLTDIGKESEGKSIAAVVSEIFAAVTQSVTGAVTDAGAVVGDSAKALGESAKNAAGEARKTADGVIKGVKGLFGKE